MTDSEIAENAKKYANTFARRLSARHMIDELAQEAAIGILKAKEKHQPGKGPFWPYAQTWALALMRKHVNQLGGAVRYKESMPDTVGLVGPEVEADGTVRDMRMSRSLAHENAEFGEALSKVDSRTQLMIEAKIKGATNEEIGEGLGLSREYVRRRILAFAEAL